MLSWLHKSRPLRYLAYALAIVTCQSFLLFLLWILVSAVLHIPTMNVRSIVASLGNTCEIALLTLLFVLPIGICAGAAFVELHIPTRLRHVLLRVFDVLSSVPTLLYGLIGFGLLSTLPHLTLSAACITLAFLLLPRVVASTMRTLQYVPDTVRRCSISLGATRLHTWIYAVVPQVWSGLAGVMLSSAGFVFSEATVLYLFRLATGSTHLNTLGVLVLTDALTISDLSTSLCAAALMLIFALLLSLTANRLAVRAGRRAK